MNDNVRVPQTLQSSHAVFKMRNRFWSGAVSRVTGWMKECGCYVGAASSRAYLRTMGVEGVREGRRVRRAERVRVSKGGGAQSAQILRLLERVAQFEQMSQHEQEQTLHLSGFKPAMYSIDMCSMLQTLSFIRSSSVRSC